MDYSSGDYLAENPTWHAEDAPWKAAHILRGLGEAEINPRTFLDVGCGAGHVLTELARLLPKGRRFVGIDVAEQAVGMAQANPRDARVTFRVTSLTEVKERFDAVLLIDVIEHVRDFFALLIQAQRCGDYVIAHVPIEMNVSSVLRRRSLRLARQSVGHIHHFNVDTITAALIETGFDVVHTHYTAGATQLPAKTWKQRLAAILRRPVAFASEEVAAHILGGYSLLIVAKSPAST